MGAGRIDSKPVILSILIAVLLEFAAGKLNFTPLLVTGLVRILDISIFCFIFHFFSGGIHTLGLSSRRIWHGFKKGLLWSAMFGLLSGCIGGVLLLTGINPLKLIYVRLPLGANKIVLFFVVGGIIGPIAEEMLFRGIIYGYLRSLLFGKFGNRGIFFAMVISTLFFVTAHTGNSGIPLPQIVGGIVFCLAFEVEKTLLTPIFIHSVGNMALFALSFLST